MTKWDWNKFIGYWSCFYNERKYPDSTIYFPNVIVDELNDRNLMNLLEWKNGSPLSEKKNAVLKKAVDRLEQINSFKKKDKIEKKDITNFFKFTNEITNGFVWRIFIVHIARPKELPMIDRFVFTAYKFFKTGNIIFFSDNDKNINEYFDYCEFFNSIIRKSKTDFRSLDKALMAFGQFLNNPNKFVKDSKIKKCK